MEAAISPAAAVKIEAIAREHLWFDSLDTQHCGKDFKEVAVWNVREALEAAYLAGKSGK